MQKTTLFQLTPDDLVERFGKRFFQELLNVLSETKFKNLHQNDKPHLTRKETALFFDVSLNCINDWSKKGILKPIKVGQRTYFRKSDLLDVMFNQLKN